jgi:hypothetical protein
METMAMEAARTRRRTASAAALALVLAACGGNDGNNGGNDDPIPGGTVAGAYILTLTPAAACATTPAARVTFDVEAHVADSALGAGIQLVSEDAQFFPPGSFTEAVVLEGELKYDSPAARGTIATTHRGFRSREGFVVWVNGIATGQVAHLEGQPGEISSGELSGALDFGDELDRDDRGSLGACGSPNHRWSLTLRP